MKWYVTMTWDNWPEGGSFGTVVEAAAQEQAEALCRQAMADSRAETDYTPEYYLENYSAEWHVVDCFPLAVFVQQNLEVLHDQT